VAGCGTREQHMLQRGGTEDAAVQVGQDGGEVGGSEARRNGGEGRGSGAMADGVEQMAAVAEQDADGVEHKGDALGHGVAGPIRLGTEQQGLFSVRAVWQKATRRWWDELCPSWSVAPAEGKRERPSMDDQEASEEPGPLRPWQKGCFVPSSQQA
jgi:hypothetical protein